MLLQLTALRCILTSHVESLFELIASRRSTLINLHLIPALLKIVGLIIVTSVCITESNILNVVTHKLLRTWREIILRVVHEQRMPPYDNIGKHRLTTTIRTDDGNVLAIKGLKVNRLCHPPLRHSANAILYPYYSLCCSHNFEF